MKRTPMDPWQRSGTRRGGLPASGAERPAPLDPVRKYSLLAIAFLSGGIVLLLEVLGTRILSPYLGSSFSVWVNMIGTILGSLSLGYYLGGILADRNQKLLPFLLLLAACACSLVHFERRFLPAFGTLGLDWGSLLAALLIFAPPSTVLGMLSPFLIKIAADDPRRIGRTSGGIYAASTIGSIAGTFVGGFWLIPHFPVSHILAGMVVALLALSLGSASTLKSSWAVIAVGLTAAAVGVIALLSGDSSSKVTHIFEKNSRYYNIRVNEVNDNVRLLTIDGAIQSGRRLAPEGILFPYVELSGKIIQNLEPAPRSALVIGGGGYAIPQYIVEYAPAADVTVVEIDPEITAVAKRFFSKNPGIRITTVNEDGRVFLNRNREQFDVVYTDAYASGNSIPPHLATREAFSRMSQALKPGGVLIINIVSARTGRFAIVYKSLLRTIKEAFRTTATFSTLPENFDEPQNLILVASNASSLSEDSLRRFETFRCHETPELGLLLTDDFAPVEVMAQDIIRKMYPEERQFQ